MFEARGLYLYGILDAGIPNAERVAIRVDADIDLTNYGILIALRGAAGGGIPLRDNFFWFGSGWVKPGDWIFVYTATGAVAQSQLPNSDNFLYSMHWGRATTIFQDRHLAPVLFIMDQIQFAPGLPALGDLAHVQTNPMITSGKS